MKKYALIKLRLLFRFYLTAPAVWYREIWQLDGDQSLCCSGHECECRGVAFINQWEWALLKRPNLEDASHEA